MLKVKLAVIAESKWRALEWVCERRSKAVLEIHPARFWFEEYVLVENHESPSTCGWARTIIPSGSTDGGGTHVDEVWDKLASEWAGNKKKRGQWQPPDTTTWTISEPWWKTGVAYQVQKFGEYVKHIYREHNQEADHKANWFAEKVAKVMCGKRSTTQTRGKPYGDTRTAATNKCKQWMRYNRYSRRWITINNMSVPFEAQRDHSEETGAYILTEVLALMFGDQMH